MTYLRGFIFVLVVLLCISLTHAQSNPVIPEAQLTFTTIDVPGSGLTAVGGINSVGDMVGWYAAENTGPASGFLLSNGSFTLFDYPGGNSTYPHGINDSGLISGWAYVRHGSAASSFLYDGTTFATIRAPGKSATIAWGINNAGIVVGGYGTLGATRGFGLHGHSLKDISPPGDYIYVFGTGINNFGRVVGTADDGSFLYARGQFKTISVPGASMTQALGINDNGVIVGWYASPSFAGFALMNGKFVKIQYPGAVYTFPVGINSAGQIVGQYALSDNTYHGFVTSPITTADFR